MITRIIAMVLRYGFLYRRSIARTGEILFWPVMNLLVWGFLTVFLTRENISIPVRFLLGAIVFWDLLYRSQQAITLGMTEEIWVRNLINLFVTPLTPAEMVTGMCVVGMIKALLTTILLGLLSVWFYQFDLLVFGPLLIPFFFELILFGWAVGLFTMGLILRFGHAAEALIWGVPFLIQPVTAVFYPVSVLPQGLRWVAYALPSTYVFEGMRAALGQGSSNFAGFGIALFLNLVYLIFGGFYFAYMLKSARVKGTLMRMNLE